MFDVVTIVKPETDWFMNRLSSSSSTELLYECLANGIALVVSDASYFPLTQTGACAWSIFSSDCTEFIQGGGGITGSKDEQGSYFSELGGQLGIAATLSEIQLPNDVHHVTRVCDGILALQTVGKDKVYIKHNGKRVDLISYTSALWEKSKTFHSRACLCSPR